jgi:outer membrane protein OmpA-like peptidoglycan-associated protein
MASITVFPSRATDETQFAPIFPSHFCCRRTYARVFQRRSAFANSRSNGRLKGLTDPPGVKRNSGAVLVYRDDAAYDEVKFASGKVNDIDDAFPHVVASGKRTGVVMGVAAASPEISSAFCSDAYQKQLTVWVARVEPQAREQQMVAISASETAKRIDANGRVALYGIFFDTGKADIKPESKASLDQIGELMKSRPNVKLHVVGHTDNVGAMDVNMSLSKRRAESVVAALAASYNLNRARLTGNGVASLAPVQTNSTETGRAKNRRVELVLQ